MNQRYVIALQCIIRVITLNSPFNNVITNQDRIVDSICNLIGVYVLAKLFLLIQLFSHKENDNFDQIVQYFKEQPIKICSNVKWQTLNQIKQKNQNQNQKQNQKSTNSPLFSKNMLEQINICKITQILLNYFTQYNPTSIMKVAQYAQIIECQKDQIIVQQGQVDDGAIYFLFQGTIELITVTGEILQSVTQPLSVFGELAFYTQGARSLSVRAQENTVLLQLNRNDFIRNLRQEDKEKYFQKRDQILYQDQYPFSCLCCQQSNHSIIKCQKLLYRPTLAQVLKQYDEIHNEIQERIQCKFETLYQVRRKKYNRSMKAHFLQNEISINELISLYKNNNHSNGGISINNSSVAMDESYNNNPIILSIKSQFSHIGQDDEEDDEINEINDKVSDDEQVKTKYADIFFRDNSKQYSRINVIPESSKHIQKTKSINSFAALGNSKYTVTANNFREFGCKDFEKMCAFTYFHPLDNYNKIIGYKC